MKWQADDMASMFIESKHYGEHLDHRQGACLWKGALWILGSDISFCVAITPKNNS